MIPVKWLSKKAIRAFIILLAFAPKANAQTVLDDTSLVQPRYRVIIDNDFAGDPDGLFQLVHHLLSPSVEVRAIIGSHLAADDGFDKTGKQAENAAKEAMAIVKLLHKEGKVPVIAGSNIGMKNDSTPVQSDGVEFIIKEALRTDTKLPLFVVCGAGLTEIASAVLSHPEIENKITLIWIGGAEYTDLALPPPGFSSPEYNLNIDINAAKVIFDKSAVNVWQVPRNVYRQCIVSYAELLNKVKNVNAVGSYLVNKLESIMKILRRYNLNIGEVYVLGDSPLVLLTALQSTFEADPSSSFYVLKQAPYITNAGDYKYNANGRNIRVYDKIDTRLMFEDFFAKLALLKK